MYRTQPFRAGPRRRATTRVGTLLFLCAGLAAPLAAQPPAGAPAAAVRGVVVAAESGLPIEGAVVSAGRGGPSGVTSAQGRFQLRGVPAGRITVRVEYIGRTAVEQAVVVEAGAATEIELRLPLDPIRFSDVVVSASREERRRAETPASIGVVDGAALRDTRPSHPSEVLNRVAGVWVNVTGGEGHMTAIRQPKTTNPVYLFLEDGLPTRSTGFFNHNALYEVNVPQSDRIEVIKGPGTALYGSDAIGGVVNVSTRSPWEGPSVAGSVEAGGHGYGRALLSTAFRGERDALRADANFTRTDGWRRGTAYDRQSGTLRWDRRLGAGSTLRAVATFSSIDQATAGASAISRDDYVANPTINYTPISYRQVRAARAGVAWERLGARTLISVTPFVRWNEMEMLPNWSLAFDPAVSVSGHSSAGVLARVRADFAPLRARVIGGVDVDYSPGSRLERAVTPVRDGAIFVAYTEGATLYDYDVRFRGVSPYLQAEAAPLDRLRVTAGLRYDHLGYHYENRLEPVAAGRHRRPASTDVGYSHVSPKLGVTYELDRAFNVFAAYGHGFRAPSEGQLFRQGQARNTVALRPVLADQLEVGARGEVGAHVRYELAAYDLAKTDDILSYRHADGSTETVNAGSTRHRGAELSVVVTPAAGVRVEGSLARARHTYEKWTPHSTADLSGNEMEEAPRTLAGVVASFSPAGGRRGTWSAEWSRVGSFWMDAQNTHRYGGHDLLHLRGALPVGGGVHVFGRVTNATNARYAEGASFVAARGEEFAPGLPRTLYLGVEYR